MAAPSPADMVIDAPHCPQSRAERLIAIGRVVLAIFSLLAIWLDPSEPAKYEEITYTFLVSYVAYAGLMALLAWRAGAPLVRLRLLPHKRRMPA